MKYPKKGPWSKAARAKRAATMAAKGDTVSLPLTGIPKLDKKKYTKRPKPNNQQAELIAVIKTLVAML